jgi:hypothetical protein
MALLSAVIETRLVMGVRRRRLRARAPIAGHLLDNGQGCWPPPRSAASLHTTPCNVPPGCKYTYMLNSTNSYYNIIPRNMCSKKLSLSLTLILLF